MGYRRYNEDSGDDYDLDLDQRTRGIGGRPGRIILLGDGTEVLTDGDDTEMVDHDEEDKDLESQVSRGQSSSDAQIVDPRSERGNTPAPQSRETQEASHTPATVEGENPFDAPSSTAVDGPSEIHEAPKPKIKAAADSDIPTKLVNPPIHKS